MEQLFEIRFCFSQSAKDKKPANAEALQPEKKSCIVLYHLAEELLFTYSDFSRKEVQKKHHYPWDYKKKSLEKTVKDQNKPKTELTLFGCQENVGKEKRKKTHWDIRSKMLENAW